MSRHLLLYLVALLLGYSSDAQQSILLNQSSYNLFTLNPAAIGLNEDLTTNCHYKKNWLGLAESPELMQLTIDGALSKNKYALGLNLLNEKAGMFSKTYFSGAFRYRLRLNKEHNLHLGLSAGFQRQLSDFSKIKADAPDEFSQWPQQQAVNIPDASVGLVYTFKKIYITLAANQLLQQNYTYKEPVFNKELHYRTVAQFIFSAQNTFVLKPEILLYTPQLTLRTPQGLPVQFDLVNTFLYKNKLLLGVGYRYFYACYANIGFHISEKLRVIYSYEYSQKINNYTKGGHEIGLTFGLSNKPVKAPIVAETANQDLLEEIYQKLDLHDQQIEVLHKKVDSLDKNLANLKSELQILKSKQVDPEEIKLIMSRSATQGAIPEAPEKKKDSLSSAGSKAKNKIDKAGKYKVISPASEKDFPSIETEQKANYKIVLGVYQISEYARAYQKFLKREFEWESGLIQLQDHPKKYIYVCTTQQFNTLSDALLELKKVRSKVKSQAVEITHGEAWILQTLLN